MNIPIFIKNTIHIFCTIEIQDGLVFNAKLASKKRLLVFLAVFKMCSKKLKIALKAILIHFLIL
ncbi:hypothetical protein EKK58_04200 [Candidatus Dependentiae bacterium]|nr:MAG: hypothetical protein EKK58_04200 [Candidatus Dependentiae bacterium]